MAIAPVTVYSSLTAAELLYVQNGAAGVLALLETTAPSATAGYGKVYVKSSDSKIYFKDDGGTEYDLTAGASGANTALSNLASVAINTTLVSDTDNTDALGTAAIGWSDLFLGDGAVITFSSAPSTSDVTITHSSNTLTIAGGNLALGTNSLTMTGSIAATGARVTKGWFTDVESTNMFTVGGTSLASTFAPIASPTFTGTVVIPTPFTLGATSVTTTGTQFNYLNAATGTTGTTSTNIVFSTSPALTTPSLGAATATSINGVTISATSGTLTITNAKTLAVTNTLTFSGTDSTVMTFPSTSATIARTDAANTFTGASTASAWVLTAPTITTSIVPTSDDGAALGDATHNFSDLFLASGALIKFASTNVVLTHSSGILTVSTGDLRVTTAGSDATSVVTVGGTQTLTNKTLTSPTLTTPSAFTTGGVITLAENTSIAYDPAGSADGKYTGLTIAGTAGEALAFGDVIVLDVTAGKWFKGSVSAAAAADGDLRGGTGMCVLAAAGDASATTILLHGTCRADANFPALTIGSVVYATTTGDITVTRPSTTDHIIKVLGFALTADEIVFNPSMDWITNV